MVTIKIFIEGGIVPHLNDNALTISNNEKFREAFRKLFSEISEFRIEIETGGGYEQTINNFKKNYGDKSLLLIDLENQSEKRDEQIIFFGLSGFEDSTFFMTQKMEAWIISQLDVIDKIYFSQRKASKVDVSLFKYLAELHPTEINNPDVLLDTILKENFEILKKGKMKPLRYKNGKLKIAPIFLEQLSLQKLQHDFQDVKNIIVKIKS